MALYINGNLIPMYGDEIEGTDIKFNVGKSSVKSVFYRDSDPELENYMTLDGTQEEG